MNYDISLIVPGIRVNAWQRMYDSFKKSFTGKSEVILISPYDLPENLQEKEDIVFIKSFRCPVACQQIAHKYSKGKWIMWGGDESVFLPGAVDNLYNKVKDANYKTVAIAKYTEGKGGKSYNEDMERERWYHMNYHKDLRDMVVFNDEYMFLNSGLLSSKLLKEFGGLDCRFETSALAQVDLSARLQNSGIKFTFHNEVIYQTTHTHENAKDHGPIHSAMEENDFPLLRELYSDVTLCYDRTNIRFNNWRKSDRIWKRRFKHDKN